MSEKKWVEDKQPGPVSYGHVGHYEDVPAPAEPQGDAQPVSNDILLEKLVAALANHFLDTDLLRQRAEKGTAP